jgi:hypothetical protein
MNPSAPQRGIDEFLGTTRQQWMLFVVALVAPVGAALAASAVHEAWWPLGLSLVGILAAASAIRPDTHTALIVIGVIVWRWLAVVDDIGTPWLPVATICLLVYHSVISLSASVPTGGNIPTATLSRWLRNVVLGGGATMGVWALVLLFDQRDAAGNGLLTGLALAIAAVGAVLIRTRSLNQPR